MVHCTHTAQGLYGYNAMQSSGTAPAGPGSMGTIDGGKPRQNGGNTLFVCPDCRSIIPYTYLLVQNSVTGVMLYKKM